MAKQLLFYEAVVPISKKKHAEWSIEPLNDYSFAKEANSVPLTAIEFSQAMREYTIVFAEHSETIMPIAVLGVKNKENLYVSGEGGWTAKYIPAFVRRYPFVFTASPEGNTFALCLDEKFAGCNQEGKGNALFTESGERSGYLENVLKFVNHYQTEYQRTEAFCRKLKELGILEAMQAQFRTPSGEQFALTGFQMVNRKRLVELDGGVLSELAKSGGLELIYSHLLSLGNLQDALGRVNAKTQH